MIVAAHASRGYHRWFEDHKEDLGVYFAPPYFTPPGQYGGPPTSGGPLPEGRMVVTPSSLRIALEQEGEDGRRPWQPGQGGVHHWEDVSAEPVEDDPHAMPPVPSPPPAPNTIFPGYENVAFGKMLTFASPVPIAEPPGQAPCVNFQSTSNLRQEECRDALLAFVTQHRCYGKRCAQEMTIDKVVPSPLLHYTLETFCEARGATYMHVPYRGGQVDGPDQGTPTPPWDLPCNPDKLFHNHVKKIAVPHTATVQVCPACEGRGFCRCHRCQGGGQVRCASCHGVGLVRRLNAEGEQYKDSCNFCGSDGRKRCYTCMGDGRVTCTQCEGWRHIQFFIQVTVTFTNHKDDHVTEKTDMPDELSRLVKGKQLHEQVLPQVAPVEGCAESARLVAAHRGCFPATRQLCQKHQVWGVPLTQVGYTWRGVARHYWVYGAERAVYCPDYPQTACWPCHLL